MFKGLTLTGYSIVVMMIYAKCYSCSGIVAGLCDANESVHR